MTKKSVKKVEAEKPIVAETAKVVRKSIQSIVAVAPNEIIAPKEVVEFDKKAFLNKVFDALEEGKHIGIEGSKEYFKKVDGKIHKYSKNHDYLQLYTFGEMETIEGLFIKK